MADGPARRVGRGVWRLSLRGVNAYLCELDGGGVALVDAGNPWDAGRIREGLRSAGFAPADVRFVLLTHYDLDHVGGLAALSLDAPVYAGEPDGDYLLRRDAPTLRNHKGALQRLFQLLVPTPPNEIRPVADGQDVEGFTAYRTPGHSPGHTAYVDGERGVAFLGDMVTGGDGDLDPSPWAVCYDTGENRRSVRELSARAPDFAVAAMGHGDPLATGGGDALRRLARRL
ncbi:MAG: MBL fold metallo-hydrolase [Salinigranum sp.]